MTKAFIFIFSLLLFFAPMVSAQEATVSGEPDLTEKIKQRLKDTAEQGLENLKDQLESNLTGPQKKAFVGAIKGIDGDKITLEFKSFTTVFTFDAETEFVRARTKTTTAIQDLKPEDFVLVLGFVNPNQDNLIAKEVQLLANPVSPTPRQFLTGKISEIDGNQITVNGKKLTIGTKTDLVIKDTINPEVEDLQLDDNLFAIVTLDKNGNISLTSKVMVLPGKNNPAALEPTNATDSATATDSADEQN